MYYNRRCPVFILVVTSTVKLGLEFSISEGLMSKSQIYVIREMKLSDLQEVMKIERESFCEPWSRSAFIELIKSKDAISVVYDEDGVVVGYGIAIENNYLHIVNLAVKKEWRRRGIGSMLLSYLIDYAYKRALLEVRISNEEAIAFYEKLGFKKIDITERYYSNGESALIMEKKLSL
jgi:ribosomal-protein-alanine N-acetyltransferase